MFNLKKGFTLLELLLVIAVITSLAGIVFFTLRPSLTLLEANRIKDESHANDIQDAVVSYIVENAGAYPGNLNTIGGTGYYDICNYGEDNGNCVILDSLVPQYLSTIPKDSQNSTTDLTGFKIYHQTSPNKVEVYTGNDYLAMFPSGGSPVNASAY